MNGPLVRMVDLDPICIFCIFAAVATSGDSSNDTSVVVVVGGATIACGAYSVKVAPLLLLPRGRLHAAAAYSKLLSSSSRINATSL